MTQAAGTKSVRVRVRGRVQGVGFRYAAQRRATELGLVGWVRNLADGSVEAFAQGDPGALAAFLEFARSGPRAAHVAAIDAKDDTMDPTLQLFEIR